MTAKALERVHFREKMSDLKKASEELKKLREPVKKVTERAKTGELDLEDLAPATSWEDELDP